MQKVFSGFFSFFLVLLLIASGHSENYDQYKMQLPYPEDTESLPFDDGDTFYIEPGGKALHWERNGQIVATIENTKYQCLNHYVGIIRVDDEHYGILMKKDHSIPLHGEGTDRIEYWNWSEQKMEFIRSWEYDNCYTVCCDNGFLIYETGKDAILYDVHACELWRGKLSEEKEYRPYRLRMRSADDWICALNDHTTADSYNACVRVFNGQIVWRKRFEEYTHRTMCILPLADGWTAIAVSRNDGRYSPVKIYTLDTMGNIYSIHEITSNKKLLTSAALLFEAKDGTVLIYGKAVSNSQRTYLVWQLRFNTKSEACLWDTRNCEYHGDYSPGLRAGANTSTKELPVFVILKALDGSGAPKVLVPFDRLPKVDKQYLAITRIQ